jgi:hypothetical protein
MDYDDPHPNEDSSFVAGDSFHLVPRGNGDIPVHTTTRAV